MNLFQNDYETRLKEWYDLRKELSDKELQAQCVEVDRFWQQCPIQNHYLHPVDIHDWPNPWQLVYENTFCVYARALGMYYTLLLLGIHIVDIVEAKDDNNEDVVLVLVDHAKYILNYWPDTVVNNCLNDFNNLKYLDVSTIKTKIGQI
jgi:hypothetical protein